MLIGVADRRFVVVRRGRRWLIGGLTAGSALGSRLLGAVLRAWLFSFFHGRVGARKSGEIINVIDLCPYEGGFPSP
jgi:hypothetical protein